MKDIGDDMLKRIRCCFCGWHVAEHDITFIGHGPNKGCYICRDCKKSEYGINTMIICDGSQHKMRY